MKLAEVLNKRMLTPRLDLRHARLRQPRDETIVVRHEFDLLPQSITNRPRKCWQKDRHFHS